MEDRRAHDRLDAVDKFIHQHSEDISRIENSLVSNTALTKQIEANTAEMVELMRGAKGIVSLITFLAKIGIAIAAIVAAWHGFVTYIRGG